MTLLSREARSVNKPGFYATEKLRGTTLVAMDDRCKIIAAENEAKRIATFGLCGCTAVAMAGVKPDGVRVAYVQHYSPTQNLQNGIALLEAADAFARESVNCVRAVIMTPTYRAEAQAADEQSVRTLAGIVLGKLGTDSEVQVHIYDARVNFVPDERRTLVVDFGADNTTQILADGQPVEALAVC